MLNADSVRFSCTGCGDCCRGHGQYYVAVTAAEQRRIRRYLAVSPAWFERRYMDRRDGIDSLRWEPAGHCVFLVNNRCRIYSVRPAQCRTYPFWLEVTASARRWNAESRQCEGMGRVSAVVSVPMVAGRKGRRAV